MHRFLIVAICAALLLGCGSGERPSGKAASGGALKVYRHAMDGSPTNLDPVNSATVYASYVTTITYDTLYSYKYLARPYELKPNLAIDFPEISEDGLRYTIKIKSGVLYADDPAFPEGKGRELIAADFVYSIKRHFDPANRSQGAWLWQGRIVGIDEWKEAGADYAKDIPGLQALDKHTIQITLTRPYPQLIYTLAMGFSGIVPPEAVAEYGRELSVHPVGSGPFKLQRFDTAKAVFAPNRNFRKEPLDLEYEGYQEALHGHLDLKRLDGKAPPFIDRLEIDFITESAARWNSFNKGNEIQFTNVPVEQNDVVVESTSPIRLKQEWTDKYHWKSGIEAGFVYTTFNMDKPHIGYHEDPQQDARNTALRCAIRKAFDWQQRNDRFYSGIGAVFPGMITPVTPEFDTKLSRATVNRDLEGAKQLLKDNGWTPENLPSLLYGMTNAVTNRQIFEQFRGFMVELGYPSEKIRAQTFATFGDFNKAMKTSQLDIFGLGWGLDYPDAENTLQLLYGPNHSPGSNNTNYANAEYDELFRQAATLPPGRERTLLYRRMNELALQDCPIISGLSRNRIFLWHKNVIGYPDREILGGFWLRYVDVES